MKFLFSEWFSFLSVVLEVSLKGIRSVEVLGVLSEETLPQKEQMGLGAWS